MSLQITICATAVCDGCGTDWVSQDYAPHFPSTEDAVEALTGLYGWDAEEQVDGTHRLTCPSCPGRQDAPAPAEPETDHEHDWRYEPVQVVPWGGPDRHGDTWGPWRICNICHKAVFLIVAPPPGYPEWLSLDLDDADEEYLMWLDEQLDPDEADRSHTREALAHLEAGKEN